jgi:hypothetical protein
MNLDSKKVNVIELNSALCKIKLELLQNLQESVQKVVLPKKKDKSGMKFDNLTFYHQS